MTGIIIQARMGSSRFPGKVLADINGVPMLKMIYKRCAESKLQSIAPIIATTNSSSDNGICELGLHTERVSCDESDVLNRFINVAHRNNRDVVVRVTGDCPLIDPMVIDRAIAQFLSTPNCDYCSNIVSLNRRTFPRGLDVEVVTLDTLKKVYNKVKKVIDKEQQKRYLEHVTLYIRDNPTEFTIASMENDIDYSFIRWTVDTPDDMGVISDIYGNFNDTTFSWTDALEYYIESGKMFKHKPYGDRVW